MTARFAFPLILAIAIGAFCVLQGSAAPAVDCTSLPGPQAKACAVQQLNEIRKADHQFQEDLRQAWKSMTKQGGPN
jgi:hypothetical protein